MLKKVFWMFVLVSVIGVLIFGAINRTQALVGGSEETNTTAQPVAESEERLWLTLTGVVLDLDRDHMLVEVEGTGEQIEISGKSWSFARQAGFSAQTGDPVKLVGFAEGEEFEVGALENLASGQRAQMRDAVSGLPLWRGRGHGGG